jgi:hypothetical protein
VNPRDESLFFTDPQIEPSLPGEFSTLYLLRRDTESCLAHEILWPGAMCVMAGIDLLGKFFDGRDSGGSGRRFCAFVRRYLHLTTPDAEALYQLRNALLHSFGLFSAARTGGYRFQLRAEGNHARIVEHLPTGVVTVDLICLREGFDAAVNEYRNDLQTDPMLRKNFHMMFPRYGTIPIR